MALNAAKASDSNNNRVEQPSIEIGNYPGRLVQILDLGLPAFDPPGYYAGAGLCKRDRYRSNCVGSGHHQKSSVYMDLVR